MDKFMDRLRALFSRRLTEAMDEAGLNIKQLALKTGMHANLISAYTTGKHMPGVERIGLLCVALRVDPDYLMGFDEWAKRR